jgi:hypothetical protein
MTLGSRVSATGQALLARRLGHPQAVDGWPPYESEPNERNGW